MWNRLFLRARGWGIDCQVRKKSQIPGRVPGGGGMVTGRIEPCISRENTTRRMQIACLMAFDTVFDGMFVFHNYLPSRS